MSTAETPLRVFGTWPAGLRGLLAVDKAIDDADLPACLLELVRLRVSQVNGCGYCVAMHTANARDRRFGTGAGDAPRLAGGSAFLRQGAGGSGRAEALTHTADAERLTAAMLESRRTFAAMEHTQLTDAVATINVWNRLALSDESAAISETEAPQFHGADRPLL